MPALNPAERIIVALDVSSREELEKITDALRGHATWVKVGMELFYAFGGSLVEDLKKQGFKIFLDLKLHDIPSTVEKAMKNLCQLPIDMVNIHAAGGIKMMEGAVNALPSQSPPLLIAVTQLTSTSQDMMNQELLLSGSVENVVTKYAHNALQAGVKGVVASPLEVKAIKEKCGPSFLTVTPGIRLPEDESHDQKRITTPQEAFKLGTDFIVLGRSITKATNPAKKWQEIINFL